MRSYFAGGVEMGADVGCWGVKAWMSRGVLWWLLRLSATFRCVRCLPLSLGSLLMFRKQIFNLSNPTVAYKTMVSPLRWQTRVVRQPRLLCQRRQG